MDKKNEIINILGSLSQSNPDELKIIEELV